MSLKGITSIIRLPLEGKLSAKQTDEVSILKGRHVTDTQ
jgi:hypothetical protein